MNVLNVNNAQKELSHDELMELILDHYEHPRNYGELNGSSVSQKGGNPGCGDLITIYLDVDDDGVIENVSFSGEGCMVSIAGTSLVLDELNGKSISEIQEAPPEWLKSKLGKRIITTRHNCAFLGFNTLKKAAIKWRRDKLLNNGG